MRLFTLLVFMLLVSCALHAQNIQATLEASWRVAEHGSGKKRGSEWISAVVPGCVHTDLIRDGKIEHPFLWNE
jgi:beta-mannosidase